MNPGRELDALVAEKVMGAKITFGIDYSRQNIKLFDGCGKPPTYSTTIHAAWKVVEKLRHRNFSFTSHNDVGMSGSASTPGKGWMAVFHIEGGPMDYTYADTAPLAICKAALKAVGAIE